MTDQKTASARPAEDHVLTFANSMRTRWEDRARLNHRYFTESVNFADEAAWDEQADREIALYLHDLDPAQLRRGRCLEIGCGPGRILSRLAPHFATAVGIDISPTMLRHAREACRDRDNVHLLQASGLGLEFLGDESFSLVVMQAVAIHLPLPLIEQYIRESFRVLAPAGHLRFTVYRNPTAEDVAAHHDQIEDAGAKIPPGADHLVRGEDYVGHIFEDGELGPFLDRFTFSGRRIEQLGAFTFGVDLTR